MVKYCVFCVYEFFRKMNQAISWQLCAIDLSSTEIPQNVKDNHSFSGFIRINFSNLRYNCSLSSIFPLIHGYLWFSPWPYILVLCYYTIQIHVFKSMYMNCWLRRILYVSFSGEQRLTDLFRIGGSSRTL